MENTKNTSFFKKRSVQVWLIILAAVVMIAIVLACVNAYINSTTPWFTLDSNGTLSLDLHVWRIYHPFSANDDPYKEFVEIPQKYDGMVSRFDGGAISFKYSGTLKRLVENHEWVLRLPQHGSYYEITIECTDYFVKYQDGGMGTFYASWAYNRFITMECAVINKQQTEYLPFTSMWNMRTWATTGIYYGDDGTAVEQDFIEGTV